MPDQAYNDLEHAETPYVVKLHRFTPLAPTQRCFTFEHPNQAQPPIDNSRSIDLTFERADAPSALCHGFAGYFDACLCAVPPGSPRIHLGSSQLQATALHAVPLCWYCFRRQQTLHA